MIKMPNDAEGWPIEGVIRNIVEQVNSCLMQLANEVEDHDRRLKSLEHGGE